ncbi:glycosyltransferase family 39 protein [Methanosarcina sp. KYL-1]|uniref:glycosyltransferase family 39 protein n=1 Tax=Methanosarcina sp. KYL-1 TaxID=2602068 RepID=UPI002100B56E|nr:glycosyltransferase family 39 protein [Methanosarcina sp. KYL-1]MCQ1536895.1 glycosyltransferase family 39 protein [Methanosarcina sp. KYL-1]
MSTIPFIIIILITLLSILISYHYREKLDKLYNSEDEVDIEKEEEEQRAIKFEVKHPSMNKIPIINFLARQFYKEGSSVFGLAAVFTAFAAVRAPYMNYSFAGVAHCDKYATHLPNLINMYKYLNPFLNQNYSYISIFNGLDTYSRSLGYFPFFEWTFLPFMPLSEFIPLEILIRNLLTILGILLLYLIYRFFNKLFTKKIALIGTLLLAFNPVFQLTTYVTVMDLPSLIFMFVALNLYLDKKENLAYLFCGLSVLMKYSFLLIIFPTLALLILFKEKSDLYSLAKLGFLSILPTLLFRILINPIPVTTPIEGIIRLLLMPFLIYVIYDLIKKHDDKFRKAAENISKNIRYILIFLLPLILVFLIKDPITRLAADFLTDENLIFNWRVYLEIINMVKGDVPAVLFYVFPAGLVLSIFYKKARTETLAFALSSAIYLIAASKAIYFHVYYKHVFIVVLILYSLYILLLIEKTRLNKISKNLVLFLVVLLLILPSYSDSKETLNHDIPGTREMSGYLEKNLGENDVILRTQTTPRIFSLYNNAKVCGHAFYGDEQATIKKSIKDTGFVETFSQCGVKYYLSEGEGNFEEFTYLFVDEIEESPQVRTDVILSVIGQEEYYSVDMDEYYNQYRPDQYFVLEKTIGNWYLYRLE